MNGIHYALSGILATLGLVIFAAYLARRYGFEIIMAVYAIFVSIASIMAIKMVNFGFFVIPAGTIVAAATFFITDIVCELWGKEYAKKTVYVGIFGLIIVMVQQFISVHWPSSIESSDLYNQVMSQNPRVALASFSAFFISQFLDIKVFHRIKKATKGRFLWARNNGSTFTSQTVDSIVFVLLAFYGTYSNTQILSIIGGTIVFKLFIALIDTPFLYAAVWIFKENDALETMKLKL
ncbi:MAG: queuosine precursor transporter [Desulfobacteraceae bacterium]|jgi:uncharacterized integral membrane protein (TIGR00697 family)